MRGIDLHALERHLAHLRLRRRVVAVAADDQQRLHRVLPVHTQRVLLIVAQVEHQIRRFIFDRAEHPPRPSVRIGKYRNYHNEVFTSVKDLEYRYNIG